MNEATPNLVFDDAMLPRVLSDSLNGAIHFNPQRIAETSLPCIVAVCGAIQIFSCCRVVLDPHFLAVRRRNSSCEIGLTFPDSTLHGVILANVLDSTSFAVAAS